MSFNIFLNHIVVTLNDPAEKWTSQRTCWAPEQMPPSGCGAMKCHKISDALTMIRRMRRWRRWRRRMTMRRWCCPSPFTPLSDMEEQPPLAVKRPVNPKDQRHLKIKIESEKEDTGTKAFSPEVQWWELWASCRGSQTWWRWLKHCTARDTTDPGYWLRILSFLCSLFSFQL